jgi:hypothetical protein
MSNVKVVRKWAVTVLNDGINTYFLSFCVYFYGLSSGTYSSCFVCNILSNEKMGLSFTVTAGSRQRSHSQVQVLRNS